MIIIGAAAARISVWRVAYVSILAADHLAIIIARVFNICALYAPRSAVLIRNA